MSALRAAAVQMTSTADLEHNLRAAAALVAEAAARGARLVGLPENFAFIGPDADKFAIAETIDEVHPGRILECMREAARRSGVWLLLGGMPERTADPARVHNTSVLLDEGGRVVARYRKIHLFDVDIAKGAVFTESATVTPGSELVVAETPWAPLGLSVCYDLRFPELYRELARRGARVLTVPAAFTQVTGQHHWHVLLRARAIENLCFVLAPAQSGLHHAGRTTYGHALIVDPWGTVLAEAEGGEGMAVADLDFAAQDQLRRQLPCLGQRRL